MRALDTRRGPGGAARVDDGDRRDQAAELLAQNAVLLLEKLDDLALAAVDPAPNTSSKNCSGAADIFGDPDERGRTRGRRRSDLPSARGATGVTPCPNARETCVRCW